MPTYVMHPHQVLTDDHFDQMCEDGYLILHNYIRGDELRELQAAQRRVLKTWEQVRNDPQPGNSMFVIYPPNDVRMAQLYMHPELLKFFRRYLKTEHLTARVGAMLARYPGFVAGDPGHIDNGNNSLLPRPENHLAFREYATIGAWTHLEEVKEGQAPLLLMKHKHGKDLSKAEPLICPEGSICIFGNYTWHAASDFTAKEGHRFTWGLSCGRADHHWEGFKHYTHLGQDPIFRQAISGMTAAERTLMRFPPPNHHYYTKQTLAALEVQYPGWNARSEYVPMD
jgi:hypothetical protein